MASPDSIDNLSDEQKRRYAGICCYNLLGLISTAAFVCAVYSYAYCDFATRYVILQDGVDASTVCADNGFDGNVLGPTCEALIAEHGVGFEGFWATVPVDQQVCFSYTQPTPWGFVTPTFDTKFNAARGLSITGIVIGGAAWFTLMLASCCHLNQAKLKGLSCYFFLATLFQGLSLLLFRSDVCNAGFFSVYFDNPNDATQLSTNFIESVECGLSTGSRLAIAATVLYFVCNCMLPAAIVPAPMWDGDDGAGQQQAVAARREPPEAAAADREEEA